VRLPTASSTTETIPLKVFKPASLKLYNDEYRLGTSKGAIIRRAMEDEQQSERYGGAEKVDRVKGIGGR